MEESIEKFYKAKGFNRIIKFKVWYPDSNLMKGPFDIDLFYIRNSAHPEFATSHRHTYLQYTGFKDRNGTEIYEDDLLKTYCAPENANKIFIGGIGALSVVKFEYGSFVLVDTYHPLSSAIPFREICIPLSPSKRLEHADYQFEVRGNIHQNPELMENPTGKSPITK